MRDVRYWIDRCCRRLNRAVALKTVAEWLAVWLCGFGILLLSAKYLWPEYWLYTLWVGLSVVPLVWLAARRARRHHFLASDGAALLDKTLGTRGLLMTVAERPEGDWDRYLPRDEVVWMNALPQVRPVRFTRVVLLPFLFVVFGLLIPARAVPSRSHGPQITSTDSAQELSEMLEGLKQTGAIDPGQYDFYREELDKLIEESKQGPPSQERYRRLDKLRDDLTHHLANQRGTVDRGVRAAKKLAAIGQNESSPLDKRRRQELEKQVSAALKNIAKQKARLAGKTTPTPPAKEPIQRKTESGTRTENTGGKSVAESKTKGQEKRTAALPKKTPGVPIAGKSPPRRHSPKQTGWKFPTGVPKLPDLSKLPDISLLMKMAENISPEMQRELIRMARRGEFRLPNDPAVRKQLMDRVQKLLERENKSLADLQKKYGHLIEKHPEIRNLARTGRDRRTPGSQQTGGNSDSGSGKSTSSQVDSRQGAKGSSDAKVTFRDVILPPGLADRLRGDLARVTGNRPIVSGAKLSQPSGKTGHEAGDSQWNSWKRRYPPRYRQLLQKFLRKDESKQN